MSNILKARVEITGTRPLLQHAFGPESVPLSKTERSGVAGNDPTEWKATCLVTKEGQLYLRSSQVFAAIRDAAKHTRKGRGSLQPLVAATLQVEESVVLLDRFLPAGDPPADPTQAVYVDICGVRNPATKGRNVRYRLASSPGWKCAFTIVWDRTLIAGEQMRTILRDAAVFVGIGDGRSVGNGRFEVSKFDLVGAAAADGDDEGKAKKKSKQG